METNEGGVGIEAPNPLARRARGKHHPAAGRPCKACNHPERDEIDRMLISGAKLSHISERFGLDVKAVMRHRNNHLPLATKAAEQAADEAETARGLDLLATVGELLGKAMSILDGAESEGDRITALKAVREARGCIETMGKLRGEISDATQINLLVAPQVTILQTAILSALTPFPQAKFAVIEALAQIESSAS